MDKILIKNGFIIDGTGNKGEKGDILVEGDRIIKIAPQIHEEPETEVINAEGKIVCPGLIDPHTHEETVCFTDGTYELFLRQGVTTVISGNCGHSIVPGPKENIIEYYYGNGLYNADERKKYKKTFPDWNDYDSYCKAAEKCGTNINLAVLLGHGTIRWSVMNGAYPRKPNKEENEKIEQIIRTSMEQGAWGISFGLDYVPSRYADVDELSLAAGIVKEYGGVAAAHTRQSAGLETAEFLEVIRKSGAKGQVSHLSATSPEAFELIRKANEEEMLDVRVDTIPRSTGHLMSKDRLILFIMAISDELFNAGPEGVKKALASKEGREMIKKDAFIIAGDKSIKYIVLSEDPSLEGKSVLEIAKERNMDPDECMLDLIADEKKYTFWLGGASRPDFPKEGHPQKVVENPYVSPGSDELFGDVSQPFDWYELQRRGCFPIFFQMYRHKGVPVEEIIRRSTTMVAEHFGIEERGKLAEGCFADIIIFDKDKYSYPNPEEVDYHKPQTVADGIDFVLVNGKFAIKHGELKRPMSGRVLRKR